MPENTHSPKARKKHTFAKCQKTHQMPEEKNFYQMPEKTPNAKRKKL